MCALLIQNLYTSKARVHNLLLNKGHLAILLSCYWDCISKSGTVCVFAVQISAASSNFCFLSIVQRSLKNLCYSVLYPACKVSLSVITTNPTAAYMVTICQYTWRCRGHGSSYGALEPYCAKLALASQASNLKPRSIHRIGNLLESSLDTITQHFNEHPSITYRGGKHVSVSYQKIRRELGISCTVKLLSFLDVSIAHSDQYIILMDTSHVATPLYYVKFMQWMNTQFL